MWNRIEDIEGLRTLLADHPQIWFPHVRADELDLRRYLRADHGKEFLEGFDGPFLANPQQPGTAPVDLIHQGQIFVPFAALNLIHANGTNRSQDAMLQAPGDQIRHRVVDLVPGSTKFFGGFLPGKFARPMSQEMHVNPGRGVFPHAPRHFFHQHPALPAVDPSHAIDQKNQVAPEADELKPSRRRRLVVAGRGLMTARANSRGSFPRPDRDEDGLRVFGKAGSPVNKSRNGMALV